jgi:hypothetical protein
LLLLLSYEVLGAANEQGGCRTEAGSCESRQDSLCRKTPLAITETASRGVSIVAVVAKR